MGISVNTIDPKVLNATWDLKLFHHQVVLLRWWLNCPTLYTILDITQSLGTGDLSNTLFLLRDRSGALCRS